jgi:hypothetical protein
MARPTVTRAELRQALSKELQMRFARRWPTGKSGATSSGANITDTNLVQENGFWKSCWLFLPGTGEQRLVTGFTSTSHVLAVEYAPTAAIASSDTYELHDVWNASELHDAINRAIEDAFPSFFDIVTDETLVVQEDRLAYDLTNLTSTPYLIDSVFIEQATTIIQGTAAGGAATYLTAASGVDLTDVDADWKISVYAGTGRGQVRSVASVAGQNITPSVNWTTAPDTTSKYTLWNAAEESEWYRMSAVRFDAKEFPSTMYFSQDYSTVYGMRIRLHYISGPTELTTETSTTIVPQEYILHKALGFLFDQKINDNRADRQRFSALAEQHHQLAELYKQTHRFRANDATLWQEADVSIPMSYAESDPLGWVS